MNTLFFDKDMDLIQWKDKDGNDWIAEEHIVRFFGKELVEQMPDFGCWQVTFNI